jgi:hypothetical protein
MVTIVGALAYYVFTGTEDSIKKVTIEESNRCGIANPPSARSLPDCREANTIVKRHRPTRMPCVTASL